jgi:acetyltransferase
MPAYPAELTEIWDGAGERLIVRAIRAEDAPALEALFHRLSPEDIRLRFFAAIRELSPGLLTRLTRLDYARDMAFVAVRPASGAVVGVARLVHGDCPETAEFAVVVEHALKGHGLGVHLLQRVLEWGWRHGVRRVVGEILADNEPMLELARFLGFRLDHLPGETGVVHAELPAPTQAAA